MFTDNMAATGRNGSRLFSAVLRGSVLQPMTNSYMHDVT